MVNKYDKSQYLSIKQAALFTGVSQHTLRKLYESNILKGYKTESKFRMYSRASLEEFCGKNSNREEEVIEDNNYIYARVSTKKQVDDLARQIEFLQSRSTEYANYRVIQDIGSGINFKRKGLQAILDACLQGNIGELVVAHRDRLSRFAFDLIETIVKKAGGKITVIDDIQQKSSEQELAEDLLAIVHIYSCRSMGKRRYIRNKNEDTAIEANTGTEEDDRQTITS